jgi:hypothetical protein
MKTLRKMEITFNALVLLLGIFRRAPLCPFTSQGAPCPLKKKIKNKKFIGNL